MQLLLEKHRDGSVKVCPLTAWTAPPIMPPYVFLKLVWATTPAHVPEGDQGVQLLLTPRQAEEMADFLQRQLETLRAEAGKRRTYN